MEENKEEKSRTQTLQKHQEKQENQKKQEKQEYQEKLLEEQMLTQKPQEEKAPVRTAQKETAQRLPEKRMRGLYDRVNISVGTLNKIIIVLCILLVLVIAFGVAKGGYQVTFDSQGGTSVETQKRMYGERVEVPQDPTREGFVFEGWYRDANGTQRWNPETDQVTESMTLYAKWKQKE